MCTHTYTHMYTHMSTGPLISLERLNLEGNDTFTCVLHTCVCDTHMCVLHTCVCYTHVCVTHMCVLHTHVSRERLNLDEMTHAYMYIYRTLKGLDMCDMTHIVRALNFIESG